MISTTRRETIVRKLTAYHARTVKAGVSARADILALAEGVTDAEFATLVTAYIGEMRLGRVMPAEDRVTIVKAWRAKDRVGGKIGVQNVADALGVVISTVSADANSTEDGSGNGSTKTDAQKVAAMTARVIKIGADNEGEIPADLAKALADLSEAVSKITNG